MELRQLISFDGLRCGNPVSVTKVPVHPINQITTGNSSQVQQLVDGCLAAREVRDGGGGHFIKCRLLPPCPSAKKKHAKQGEQENSTDPTPFLPGMKT